MLRGRTVLTESEADHVAAPETKESGIMPPSIVEGLAESAEKIEKSEKPIEPAFPPLPDSK
jgi:hypothetical protein